MGRVTTRAMEYLKDDFTVKEDDERVENFVFVESGRDVKGKEMEKELFAW